MTVAASLRSLLERSIDYAGLFPPASLQLEPALANQAQYVRTPESWMLNAFVLPVAEFGAAKESLSRFDSEHRLCVSVLGPKTEDAMAFRTALGEIETAIRDLLGQGEDRVSIGQLEMFLPVDVDIDLLIEVGPKLAGLPVFWEAPLARAQQTTALLLEYNRMVGRVTFGYKMRTGGVAADAFPTPALVAQALVASARQAVPVKFTAGLHHPIRQFRTEVQTKMHGFLNVLGAALLGVEHNWDVAKTTAMLEDEDAGSFKCDDKMFAWRDSKIATDRLRERRKLVTTFGTCSFDEPREDLTALGLL